jgi:transcriptional regulator with XRE-family HTH domain
VPFNNGLKLLRNKRKLTVRDVERASRRIAEDMGDQRFRISNGWLAQLEHGVSIPNACTIFSLCAIYCVSFAEILRLYGVDPDETHEYQHIANPQVTQLVPKTNSLDPDPGLMVSDTLASPVTSLITGVPASKRCGNAHIRYGYIGTSDDTMYPLIRPGAVVEIDTRQRKVPAASKQLTSQFEKPIFFVELREGYAFGWCTMQSGKLVITPHPSSRTLQRHFDYPRDVDIVGRVVGYTTRCVDQDPEGSK